MDRRKIAVIIIFLLLFELRFIYIPAKKKVTSLDRNIAVKQKDRETLLNLCEEYRKRAEKEVLLRIAKKEFSLLSYTGNLIEKKNLEKNITGLQPLRAEKKGELVFESVRMGLKGITLKDIYEFLYDIEKTANGIYTSEFRMQRVKDKPHLLDVEMELFVMKKAGSSE